MCKLFRIFYDSDSFPLGSLIRQVRLWAVLDFLLVIAYSVHAHNYLNGGASGALPFVTVALATLFMVDGVVAVYLTSPGVHPTLPPAAWHANTFVNVLTVVVNMVYFILSFIQGLVAYTILGVVVLAYKSLRYACC